MKIDPGGASRWKRGGFDIGMRVERERGMMGERVVFMIFRIFFI